MLLVWTLTVFTLTWSMITIYCFVYIRCRMSLEVPGRVNMAEIGRLGRASYLTQTALSKVVQEIKQRGLPKADSRAQSEFWTYFGIGYLTPRAQRAGDRQQRV